MEFEQVVEQHASSIKEVEIDHELKDKLVSDCMSMYLKLKTGLAPGGDEVVYDVIRNLPEQVAYQFFLDLRNLFLVVFYFYLLPLWVFYNQKFCFH